MGKLALILIGMIGLMLLATSQAKKCNGEEGLCRLKFNQVTLAGTHNAGANRVMKYNAGLFMVSASSCWYRNQDYTFPQQLDFGIRFFDIDTRSKSGSAWTAHNTAYGQPLNDIIRDMANWLNQASHRNEVVAMRFHDTNIDGYGQFKNVLQNNFPGTGGKVGMNAAAEWPTLDAAVTSNKRVFIFMVEKICNSVCRSSYRFIRSSNRYDDTWQTRKVTSSCSGMPAETRAKCKSSSRPLILVSAFASKGICVSDMQGYCNHHIKASADDCYDEMKKKGRTVNFLTADFVNRCNNGQDVVTVTKQLNKLNLQRF